MLVGGARAVDPFFRPYIHVAFAIDRLHYRPLKREKPGCFQPGHPLTETVPPDTVYSSISVASIEPEFHDAFIWE